MPRERKRDRDREGENDKECPVKGNPIKEKLEADEGQTGIEKETEREYQTRERSCQRDMKVGEGDVERMTGVV